MSQQDKEQAEKVLDFFLEQLMAANESGEQQTDQFFCFAAYSLGSLVPLAVQPESIGPVTMRLVEFLTSGVQTGMETHKVPGNFSVVRVNR